MGTATPFIKWAGGKRSLLPELLKRVPKEYISYHEIFLGGGALYFALAPKKAYLSDINLRLLTSYVVVKKNPKALCEQLEKHRKTHSKKHYEESKKRLDKEKNSVKLAALFIYLNKTCFNGLYRVNRAGVFNVPMGAYKNPKIFDSENIKMCAELLKEANLCQKDFSENKIKANSFYYIDPPYHKTFSNYSAPSFNEDRQKELAEFCKKIDEKGSKFMLSNSDTPLIRSLYKNYKIEIVFGKRSISRLGTGRGKEHELIIRNY